MLIGCFDSTVPTLQRTWAHGIWVAVLADGKPLPFQSASNYPYDRFDSLVVLIFDPPLATGHAGEVFPFIVRFESASTPATPMTCSDDDVSVVVTETRLTTRAKGAVTKGGGCNADLVRLDLTRKGDSLAGIWNGADVRLIRRL